MLYRKSGLDFCFFQVFWGGLTLFLVGFSSPLFPLFFSLYEPLLEWPFWAGGVDACCQPSFFSVYLGTCKETAPAVQAQLKTIKPLFIYLWVHTRTRNSNFRTCWAIHYPEKRIKGFLPARQTQAQGRWVSLWSRYPVWPSCHPSTTSAGTKDPTGSQLHLLTSSQPLLFL